MSLRHKTLLIIGITIVCVFMALSLMLSSIWLNSFTEIESQQIRRNVERVQNVLADDLAQLNSTLSDWAYRDDTYAFFDNDSLAYMQANLDDATLANLRLNIMLFVHKSGQIAFAKELNPPSNKSKSLISSFKKHLASHPQLWKHSTSNSKIGGFVLLPEGPFLVASQPILRYQRQGRILGTLIFGRYLNAAEKKRIEALTQLKIALEPFNPTQLPKYLQTLPSTSSNTNAIVVSPLNSSRIAGYTKLQDIYGIPKLLLRVDSSREIYLTGQSSWQYLIQSVMGVGAILGFITLILLEKLVLSRLARLSAGVSRIGATGDLSLRLQESGRDELSRLTSAINQLLTTLEQSQQQLHQTNVELERRVEQRTAALTQANVQLEQSHRDKDQLLLREQVARTEAESANRIKDEFLAVLSHELRTPLNPILGWSKILRSRKLDETSTARALETIERNAQLQTQLIEDLLDVSRILRGKLSLNVRPVNLVSTIEAAIETVHLAAQAKSIQINKVFESQVQQVLGDSNRLQQVVWNLLSNAVKFTPTGGKVTVQLSVVEGLQVKTLQGWTIGQWEDNRNLANLQPATAYAQMKVIDTGKGINPEFLPYVFDYFRQENNTTTRTFGGLGLGLAIVRHLVELHGGTVQAESPGEGLGATFTVTLPLMKEVPQAVQEDKLPSESLSLEGIRVLAVDDEVDTLNLIVFILQQYGAQVKAVASASDAIEALTMWQPDVLLSDIGMPDMDGYWLIRQIRTRPPTQGGEIPAIALTAYASESDTQQVLQAGFTTHITKPVEPVRLASAIARLGQI